MKLRPMTWGRWMEFVFGALIPTVVWGWLAVIALGAVVVGFLGASYGWVAKIAGLVSMGLIFVPLVGGLVALWLLTLYGVEQVNQRSALRWFSILIGIAALILGGWNLVYSIESPRKDFTGVLVNISLIGPMIVGLKYLPQLIRGK